MAFPLFALPPEAVELVLGSVGDPEDKRALRLVCKRSCASVDSRVVAVGGVARVLEPGDEDNQLLRSMLSSGRPGCCKRLT